MIPAIAMSSSRYLRHSFLLLMLGLPATHAAELRVLTSELPPLSRVEQGQAAGLTIDLVKEMAQRAGLPAKLEVYPWKRAVQTAEEQANTLVLPLTRTPERENRYNWVAEVFSDDFLLITRRDSTVDISNLAATGKLRIGVLRGGPGEDILARASLHNAEPAQSDLVNAQKLRLGRIDAWLAARLLGLHAWVQSGGAPSDLRFGAITSRMQIYLAANRQYPESEAEKWRRALQSMKDDGSYQRLLNHYDSMLRAVPESLPAKRR